MRRYDRTRQLLALGLAFLAGEVDAVGFSVAGGYFTSFMSGNTTRLGVELLGSATLPSIPLLLIGCFVTGVTAGTLVAIHFPGRHKRLLLGGVALWLGAATLALFREHEFLFLGAAALAMGMANNVFSRDGAVTVGVTYMTGALVRTGQGIALRLLGRPADGTRGYPALWLSLATGAVCGAALFTIDPVAAAGCAAALAVLLLVLASWIETRKT